MKVSLHTYNDLNQHSHWQIKHELERLKTKAWLCDEGSIGQAVKRSAKSYGHYAVKLMRTFLRAEIRVRTCASANGKARNRTLRLSP